MKKYQIIYADPPWRFKNWSMKKLAKRGEKGMKNESTYSLKKRLRDAKEEFEYHNSMSVEFETEVSAIQAELRYRREKKNEKQTQG